MRGIKGRRFIVLFGYKLNKFGLRKCPHDHWLTNKAIWRFTHKMPTTGIDMKRNYVTVALYILAKLENQPSIDCANILANTNPNLWPWPWFSICGELRSWILNRQRNQGQRSDSSNVRVETNGRADGQTRWTRSFLLLFLLFFPISASRQHYHDNGQHILPVHFRTVTTTDSY